ncbi:MAG: fumarylacetoacetate hydrolase family protein [Armatimonadota bacterium]|nr:fumarylacetoacetate hydrolase family protein [Armatimonadota bacterium]MDR7440267.1 fumarylacetoacetate hydrolase family protein [Armatimonadota bacterium]MDR7443836.1 fumarylacetoacetate hydrolase family protein [Armatimonadota bacterium]MDR7568995.1 fumarylacetoacetate hydrolase family protein [Armatimonadota bacterium]MDR7613884.1 fumarylacetoacetate hydrolase family protein [Armatimonadota bacterium]
MKRVRFAAEGAVHEGTFREGALYDAGGRGYDPDRVVWLPPVSPTKVLGVALNYPEHAAELGMRIPDEPPLFFKPLSCLVGHRAPVVYPRGVEYLHYEVELAVVIGRRCRNVQPEEALRVVQGYTIANDITARDFVGNFYRPPVRAKGYDTFGPVGPWSVEGEIEDPHDLEMRVYVNGELRQRGNTREMLWKVPRLIAWVSSFMTLEPGDLILTGTPRGISPVRPGDVMRLEIEGIGALENPVVGEEIGPYA